MPDEAHIEVQLVVAESDQADQEEAIEESGGRLVRTTSEYKPDPGELDELDELDDSQFDPFILISASLAIGYLIKTISGVWLDHKRPWGQIVDARDRGQ